MIAVRLSVCLSVSFFFVYCLGKPQKKSSSTIGQAIKRGKGGVKAGSLRIFFFL